MTTTPDRFARSPEGPRTFRVVDEPALSAALDQDRASLRDRLRLEQPWRRDLEPSEELPEDPFA